MLKCLDSIRVEKKDENEFYITYQVSSSMIRAKKFKYRMEPINGRDATRFDAAQYFLDQNINRSWRDPDEWLHIVGFTCLDDKSSIFITESKNDKKFI